MDTFGTDDRARIRAVLIAYMKEHRIGVPNLHKRIGAAERDINAIGLKTLQRILDGRIRVSDDAVAVCARFAKQLPGARTETHRLAESLSIFFASVPDGLSGVYNVSAAEDALSKLTITHPPNTPASFIVTERSHGKFTSIYDGALVFTASGIIAVLKDRLMRTARIHMFHVNRETDALSGLLYDNGPLARGVTPYLLLQTTLERIRDAH